jgi:Ion channel
MDVALAFLGVLIVLTILWDAFETIILPRRVTRRVRLTTIFYRSIWWPWSGLTQRLTLEKEREKYLGLFGPLSLIFLLGFWAGGVILGYALISWSVGEKLNTSETVHFWTYVYLSGTNFFTLGYGDVTPIEPLRRALSELREMYEPYVAALSEFLVMPLPPWILSEDTVDNWETSAWGRIQ